MAQKPVSLIIPPSTFLLDERVFPFLGVLKVAAVLEQRGYEVEVLDLSGVSDFEEATKVFALNSQASNFGITATTPQMPAAKLIAEAIRSARRNTKIILGGPHGTLVNAAMKGEIKRGVLGRRAYSSMKTLVNLFDVIVAGDGEEAIFPALQRNSPQIIDADDPKSPLFLKNEDLSAMPFPARYLIDLNSYHYSIDGVRATSLIGQLGCPFECGFCGGRLSPFLRRVRLRSVESIISEMRFLHETYNLNGFMFYDDELNVSTEMVRLMRAISEEQQKIGKEWRLRGFIKSQLFTDEQAEEMYRAGFRWILVGFESGSPRILQNINKKSTREENTRCIDIAKRHGLKVKALMSMGHPGESEETVLATRDWLLEVQPNDFDLTIITTYPGTPYYDQSVPAGDGTWVYTYDRTGDKLYSLETDHTQFADYYKGRPGEYTSLVWTDFLSREKLVEMRDSVEREVREKLSIPYPLASPSTQYEHSMAQK